MITIKKNPGPDVETIAAALALAKQIPGTAVGEATEAAERAEAAAEIAENYGFELTLTENQDGTYTLEKDGEGTPGGERVVNVSGTTPTINAEAGTRYICGEVATLDVALPAAGIVDVVFKSGSTPTVLTVTPPTGVTVSWPAWFDPTALEASATYEINIMDDLGVVMVWA